MGNSGAKSSLLHTEATATSNPDSMNMEIPSYNTKKDVHVQNYQVQEEIPESPLSSGNEVSQSVNHCEKVDSSSMSISPASVQDKETVLICNKPKINHAPMTLAQYRKTVGIKVVNQKSSQKIGIVVSSFLQFLNQVNSVITNSNVFWVRQIPSPFKSQEVTGILWYPLERVPYVLFVDIRVL